MARELEGYEEHLSDAVYWLANDIMDDAEWVNDRFCEYNDAELARRDAEAAAEADEA